MAKVSRVMYFHLLLADLTIPEPKLSNYTESKFKHDLKEFREHVDTLKRTGLSEFRKSVIKHVPHTLVEEHRRRERIPNPSAHLNGPHRDASIINS